MTSEIPLGICQDCGGSFPADEIIDYDGFCSNCWHKQEEREANNER